MKKLLRLSGIIVAACALAITSCASREPATGVVSLAQEAMAASAELAKSEPVPPKEGTKADSATDAVATWRGSDGETQGP